MNINRNNFEEFCLLYLDNELSPAERVELEAFVAINPDLASELELMQQLKLSPETNFTGFADKSSLFRSSALENTSINAENFETWFLLYTDGELNADDRKKVEAFAAQFPAYQKSLALLQATRLVPETLTFPDKQLLYRRTSQPARITVMRVWRVAAAAALILGGIWIGMNTTRQTSTEQPTVAKAIPDNKKEQPGTIKAANTEPATANTSIASKTADTQIPAEQIAKTGSNRDLVAKASPSESRNVVKNKTVKPVQESAINEKKDEMPDVAIADPSKNSNHLPTRDYTNTTSTPTVNSEKSGAVAMNENTNEIVDKPLGGPNAGNVKNDFASEALLNASENKAAPTNYAQEDDHKSPLRGVFRKASRILNRVTSPDLFKSAEKQNK